MTHYLQHLAALLIASALLLPMTGIQEASASQSGGDLTIQDLFGDTQKNQEFSRLVVAAREQVRICTTSCSRGTNDNGQPCNSCVMVCEERGEPVSVENFCVAIPD